MNYGFSLCKQRAQKSDLLADRRKGTPPFQADRAHGLGFHPLGWRPCTARHQRHLGCGPSQEIILLVSFPNAPFQWRVPTTLGTLASDSLLPSCLKGNTHTKTKQEKTRTHSLCLQSTQVIWRLSPSPLLAASLSFAGKAQNTNGQILDFCFLKYRAPISSWSLSLTSSTLSNPILSTASHIFLSRLSYFFLMPPSPQADAFHISLTFLCMLLEWTSGSHLLTPCWQGFVYLS